ncbi:MAG: flagellar protein FliT [Chloroflexi bacterium]|nr:flagellar protein FliT [Chloroflexota bacterium]
MAEPRVFRHPPLIVVVQRLLALLQHQADALQSEDFARLARLSDERDRLVMGLDAYGPADLSVEARALLEQVAALDQQVLALARAALDRADQERRTLRRGQSVLATYARPGAELNLHARGLDLNG